MEIVQTILGVLKNELLSHTNSMLSQYVSNQATDTDVRYNAGKLSLAQTILTSIANIEKQVFGAATPATGTTPTVSTDGTATTTSVNIPLGTDGIATPATPAAS